MQTILLVDDDELVTGMLSGLLEREGFEVVVKHNGQQAIHALNSDVHFDLLITDLIMPVQDGFDVLQFVKEHNPALPTLAISGGGKTTTSEDLSAAVQGMSDGLLQKPVKSAVLLEEVRKLLGDQSAS